MQDGMSWVSIVLSECMTAADPHPCDVSLSCCRSLHSSSLSSLGEPWGCAGCHSAPLRHQPAGVPGGHPRVRAPAVPAAPAAPAAGGSFSAPAAPARHHQDPPLLGIPRCPARTGLQMACWQDVCWRVSAVLCNLMHVQHTQQPAADVSNNCLLLPLSPSQLSTSPCPKTGMCIDSVAMLLDGDAAQHSTCHHHLP